MNLQDEIEAARTTVASDSYPMSIGELQNLYRDNELDIHPEFQRFFRWTDTQKSRLIESILINIPLPSIFVAQRKDGVWDVIDGLQRLSTILQLMGVLKDEDGKLVGPLTLKSTKYLPSLAGKVWDDDFARPNSLTRAQQLLIKRAKIDLKIILPQSDEATKYELFQRLNTGGSPLSEQELRNCIWITVDRTFYTWASRLAREESFRSCIALSERLIDEKYDVELVTRFLVFRSIDAKNLRNIGDMGEFLTDESVKMASSPDFDREEEEQAFKTTFSVLSAALQDDSFRRYDAKRDRFAGAFLISAFEAVAIGIGHNYRNYRKGKHSDLADKVKSLWSNQQFLGRIGSGVRGSQRVPHTIPLGRDVFKR